MGTLVLGIIGFPIFFYGLMILRRAGREGLSVRPLMVTLIGFLVFIALSLGITYVAARRTHSAAQFYAAGGRITGFQNGLALAGDYMSAASFLGIAGLVALSGFDWAIPVASTDNAVRVIEGDTVASVSQVARTGTARIRVGGDTLAFDLRPLARWYLDSMYPRMPEPNERLRVLSEGSRRRGALEVTNLSGTWSADSLSITYWTGSLLLGADRDQTESSRSDDDS